MSPTALLPIINLADRIIGLYVWVLILSAVLSWLLAFGVVNRHNRLVGTLHDIGQRLTEPLLRPIRNVMPNVGGVDLSPIILILLLQFLREALYAWML